MQIAKKVKSYEKLTDTSEGYQRALITFEDGLSIILSLDGMTDDPTCSFTVRHDAKDDEIIATLQQDTPKRQTISLNGSKVAKDAWDKVIWGE